MTVVVYILIALVALLTVLIGYIVVRDEVKARKEERKERAEEAASKAPTPEAPIQERPKEEAPAPIHEEKAPEPIVIPTERPEPEGEPSGPASPSDVAFDVKKETLEEKYLALPDEIRGYYDEIVKAANAVEGSKRFKNENYEDYKLGKNRLVRLKIRRGALIAELTIPNFSFQAYQSGGAALKQAPTSVKVADEPSLNAVKEGIAYTVRSIGEEKARKKDLARERRRKAREEKQKEE